MEKNNQYLKSALKLGLSGKASVVYVFLLESKIPVAPIRIINSTNLHRQYVYNALKELQQKDLVEIMGHGRGVKYFAHTPNKMIKVFEEKRIDAIDGISHLMELYKKTPHGTVEIIEGAEAVIESEIKIMKEQKINSWLDIIGGAGTGFLELFGDRINEYEMIRKKVKCKLRYIGAKNDIEYNSNTDMKNRYNYEARYLENIDNIVNICLRPKSVSFNIYSPETMVIRIKNTQTITGQKALFEILWGVAKK